MLRFAFSFILFFFLLGLVLIISISWYLLPKLPDVSNLENIKLQVPLRIYTQDDSLIAEFGEKRREPVSIKNVPPLVIQAFLAAEDARFYQHPGVDWRGIMRAVIYLAITGDKKQGGSTITMQVARNFFLSREKTYVRKLNEILLALKIEKQLSKDGILELYLNKIYLGHRSYGIKAAAQTYYGSQINEMTLAQIAMLAALPKAPSAINPIADPQQAKTRRNYILKRMLEENFIDEESYQIGINSPITATLHSPQIQVEADYIAEMVRKQLVEQYGNNAYIDGLKVKTTIKGKHQMAANHALRTALSTYDERHGYRGPEHQYNLPVEHDETVWQQLLKNFLTLGHLHAAMVVKINGQSITVYSLGIGLIDIEWPGLSWANTYLNENQRGTKPKSATDFLRVGDIIRVTENSQGKWKLAQLPNIEGAFISADPNNGATLALVGGFDFQRSKFNRVTQAHRQIGSGVKPFIYSSALAKGYTAATLINDAPVTFKNQGIGDTWRPENYGRKNYGITRLREALIHSRNLVSIRLLDEIGIPFTLEHFKSFGFNIDKLPKNLSLSLGSATVTPWKMVAAYCVFANGGYRVEPYFIESISNSTGDILYQAEPAEVCPTCQHNTASDISDDPNIAPRVIDKRNIWIMNSMTRDVIKHGTGRRALSLQRQDLSGKTGTTNDQRDAWFYGYNVNIVAIAWVGFDDFQPMGNRETGARAALPMWIEYMKTALQDIPETISPKPSGLIYSRISKKTGELAQTNDSDTIFEVFRSEHAPTISSDKSILSSDISTSELPELF